MKKPNPNTPQYYFLETPASNYAKGRNTGTPAARSWWAEAPRDGFTAVAEQELPRMRGGKFGQAFRFTDGPDGPSLVKPTKADKRGAYKDAEREEAA